MFYVERETGICNVQPLERQRQELRDAMCNRTLWGGSSFEMSNLFQRANTRAQLFVTTPAFCLLWFCLVFVSCSLWATLCISDGWLHTPVVNLFIIVEIADVELERCDCSTTLYTVEGWSQKLFMRRSQQEKFYMVKSALHTSCGRVSFFKQTYTYSVEK